MRDYPSELEAIVNDPRSVDELINAALGEPEDTAWNAVSSLHWRGTREVLVRATELCGSECPQERKLGADILGQLGVPERTDPDQCVRILLAMLDREQDDLALRSIFIALSHQDRPEAIPAAARFASHPDPEVRYAVVLALNGQTEPAAIDLLIVLSRDPSAEVRDWATFGLGTILELDSPDIRTALADRLDDPDDDTRGEALVGLARRGDRRVVPVLVNEFHSDFVSYLALEAAELIGAPELHAPLVSIRDWFDDWPDLINRAIAACRPGSLHSLG